MTLILGVNTEDTFTMYADNIASVAGIQISDDMCTKIFDLPAVIVGTLGSADDMVAYMFNKKKLDPLDFKRILVKSIVENIIPLDIELLVYFKATGELWNFTVNEEAQAAAFRYGSSFVSLGIGSTIAKSLHQLPGVTTSTIFESVNKIYPIISCSFQSVQFDKTNKKNPRKK